MITDRRVSTTVVMKGYLRHFENTISRTCRKKATFCIFLSQLIHESLSPKFSRYQILKLTVSTFLFFAETKKNKNNNKSIKQKQTLLRVVHTQKTWRDSSSVVSRFVVVELDVQITLVKLKPTPRKDDFTVLSPSLSSISCALHLEKKQSNLKSEETAIYSHGDYASSYCSLLHYGC